MDEVFIHRGIVLAKGLNATNLLTVRNAINGNDENPRFNGVFVYPSTTDFIEERRKSSIGFTERYTKKNPDLEPLVLTFKVTEETFELLRDRFAIIYIGSQETIPDFYSLLWAAKDSNRNGDPMITFDGEGLTPGIMRQLELVVGSRNLEGEFIYSSYDEYMIQREGTVSRGQEVK